MCHRRICARISTEYALGLDFAGPMILNEPSKMPISFHDTSSEISQDWLNYFARYATFKQLLVRLSLSLFARLMCDAVNTRFFVPIQRHPINGCKFTIVCADVVNLHTNKIHLFVIELVMRTQIKGDRQKFSMKSWLFLCENCMREREQRERERV